jgi:hypothetical protein
MTSRCRNCLTRLNDCETDFCTRCEIYCGIYSRPDRSEHPPSPIPPMKRHQSASCFARVVLALVLALVVAGLYRGCR